MAISRFRGLIERRAPVTISPNQRRTTTRSRHHLRDLVLRFCFRFIEPNLDLFDKLPVFE